MDLLLAHAAATLYMTGLIWFVQLVHYPLFERVDRTEYPTFQREHSRRTGWAVGVPMFVEAATAVALLWIRPPGLRVEWVALGAVLLLLIWLSTAFVQARQHRVLESGFDPALHRKLVVGNWLRTVLWSVRGVLSLLYLRAAAA